MQAIIKCLYEVDIFQILNLGFAAFLILYIKLEEQAQWKLHWQLIWSPINKPFEGYKTLFLNAGRRPQEVRNKVWLISY